MLEGVLGFDDFLGAVTIEGEDELGDEGLIVIVVEPGGLLAGFGTVNSCDEIYLYVEVVGGVVVVGALFIGAFPRDRTPSSEVGEDVVASAVVPAEVRLVGTEVGELGRPINTPIGSVEIGRFGNELVLLVRGGFGNAGKVGVVIRRGRGSTGASSIVAGRSGRWS